MTTTKRILFCGTPEFAVASLEALAQDSDFQIVKVLSQPDRPAGRGHKLQASPVKKMAQSLGLEVTTPENINDPEVIQQLAALKLDAIVVVAYGQILKKEFLNLCPGKAVNLHGSCLPRWRGAAPIQRALMAGDREGGVSLQVIVRKLDAGPVIGERHILLPREMNAFDLHDVLQKKGVELFQMEFKKFLDGEITPREQDESLVTLAAKIEKNEARIDWQNPAHAIHDQIRGLAMGPQAMTSFDGLQFKIHKSRVLNQLYPSMPGTVIAHEDQKSFTVVCGEKSLEILELQPESKKRMTAEDFLRGFTFKSGGLCGA